MRETEKIVDSLQRAFERNAWHGPALMETLDEVDHHMASRRPVDRAHSIWELVIHLTAWKDIVRQRLSSETPILASDAEDWPQVPDVTAANWTTTLERLRRSHDQLIEAIRSLEPEDLDRTVPGKDYNVYVMLLGAAQHDDYHAGQVSLLKKAANHTIGASR